MTAGEEIQVDVLSVCRGLMLCHFLEASSDGWQCDITYGTDSTYTNLPYTASSGHVQGHHESTLVTLTTTLSPGVMYFFKAVVFNNSAIPLHELQGSFTTPPACKQHSVRLGILVLSLAYATLHGGQSYVLNEGPVCEVCTE